jgi:hypothetical protein
MPQLFKQGKGRQRFVGVRVNPHVPRLILRITQDVWLGFAPFPASGESVIDECRALLVFGIHVVKMRTFLLLPDTRLAGRMPAARGAATLLHGLWAKHRFEAPIAERPDRLPFRASTHFYITEAEMDRLAEALPLLLQ